MTTTRHAHHTSLEAAGCVINLGSHDFLIVLIDEMSSSESCAQTVGLFWVTARVMPLLSRNERNSALALKPRQVGIPKVQGGASCDKIVAKLVCERCLEIQTCQTLNPARAVVATALFLGVSSRVARSRSERCFTRKTANCSDCRWTGHTSQFPGTVRIFASIAV